MFSADSTFKMRMMKFNIQAIYVPGKDLQGADALSTRLKSSDSVDGIVDESIKAVEEDVEGNEDALPVSKDGLLKIKEATRQDLHMQELIRLVNARGPNWITQVVASVRPFRYHKDLLTANDRLLLRKHEIVILKFITKDMPRLEHDWHLGMVKTKKRTRQSVWWRQKIPS